MTAPTDKKTQQKVIAFLSDPASYPNPPQEVETHETHGAMVFLAGEHAYKIKKPVKLPYLDFSTLAKREAICRRELEINLPAAPGLYLGLIPITQQQDGSLALNGPGEPVEWALHMQRFDQTDLFDQLPGGTIADKKMIDALARAVLASHRQAKIIKNGNGPEIIEKLIAQLSASFARSPGIFAKNETAEFTAATSAALLHARYCLRYRGRRGYIRRCHGDLHLRNIVLMDGHPVLFDALEFDEELASIDTLYDLAFLLMDLNHRKMAQATTRLLNRYLSLSGADTDLYGLKALPLFLALRAGVRAMVTADLSLQKTGTDAETACESARVYFREALQYLKPPAARLIAVGGFSGTGKTTLAAALAEWPSPGPGYLHIRTDVERKAMFHVAENDSLPPDSYTQESSDAVYDRVLHKAYIALKSGQRVIVDAVFAKEVERQAMEDIARKLDVPFTGLWLEAEETTLAARVTARRNDASDATADVVRLQIQRGAQHIRWRRIDAGGTAEDTFKAATKNIRIN
jgi:aminoglycoside phosphotransferase family enzyme/adenylate kinase family enzyme|tara:strand:+ start:966 stop:2522 length:1557 start_codon:yes stop_codon:yes gene_type:complete